MLICRLNLQNNNKHSFKLLHCNSYIKKTKSTRFLEVIGFVFPLQHSLLAKLLQLGFGSFL